MRVLFAGGSDFSLPSLKEVSEKFDIAAVLTHPDTTSGRGKRLKVNPVKAYALEKGLTVLEPDAIHLSLEEDIRKLSADILVAVAYGKLFPAWFLELFPRGGVNLHPSLLPLYRGPSPVTAAILNGDSETGITIQGLALKMDAGDILCQEKVPLDGTETTESLLGYTSVRGAEMLAGTLAGVEAGEIRGTPQNEDEATYCYLIRKEDGRINWSDSAQKIERMIRGYQTWPKAFSTWGDTEIYFLEASVVPDALLPGDAGSGHSPGTVAGMDKKAGILIQTGNGLLGITRLQQKSKKALDWKSFLNGAHHFIGSCVG